MQPSRVKGIALALLGFARLTSATLTFHLRHLHAVSSDSAKVIFSDVTPRMLDSSSTVSSDSDRELLSSYSVSTDSVLVHRPPTKELHAQAILRSKFDGQSSNFPWDEEEMLAPNTSSRATLLTLAKMTNNAYLLPGDKGWYDLGDQWNASYQYGWEPDDDGFRGHVFATEDNSTVILSIKGTSAPAGIWGGGPTTKKDKLNDNLLFSCCCARVDWTWSTVCDCYRGGWNCHQDCVETALTTESLFYPIGINLYNNLTYLYPYSNIWVIGHSLGGSLGSLIGATFGVPVVTFEAPGEKMAASRLHLPTPPSTLHITHVYHTADPIAMGTCTGVLSSCALGGYAMESKCHTGVTIVYDTIQNLSWSSDVRTHTIGTIIERLLSEPWAPSEEIGREVPEPTPQDDCVECYRWDFEEHD
ncbi:alpha/beta-hydrolase [Flagelloscypha sp. PMI_526]|nr:alpha/beta-hydrolase [Flagelloscypha sp. PMI_526]